jgi:hypothetical protein
MLATLFYPFKRQMKPKILNQFNILIFQGR